MISEVPDPYVSFFGKALGWPGSLTWTQLIVSDIGGLLSGKNSSTEPLELPQSSVEALNGVMESAMKALGQSLRACPTVDELQAARRGYYFTPARFGIIRLPYSKQVFLTDKQRIDLVRRVSISLSWLEHKRRHPATHLPIVRALPEIVKAVIYWQDELKNVGPQVKFGDVKLTQLLNELHKNLLILGVRHNELALALRKISESRPANKAACQTRGRRPLLANKTIPAAQRPWVASKRRSGRRGSGR